MDTNSGFPRSVRLEVDIMVPPRSAYQHVGNEGSVEVGTLFLGTKIQVSQDCSPCPAAEKRKFKVEN